MVNALRDAGFNPEQVDYVNAHGTSTPLGDVAETVAIKRAFGDHAKSVAVSSTKSTTGHMIGAAGGAEAIFSVLALHEQVIPPTINLENPDPACDLDYTPNVARQAQARRGDVELLRVRRHQRHGRLQALRVDLHRGTARRS